MQNILDNFRAILSTLLSTFTGSNLPELPMSEDPWNIFKLLALLGNYTHFRLYVAQEFINKVFFIDWDMNNEKIKNIAEALNNTSITHVIITGSMLDAKDAQTFAMNLENTMVTHVDFSNNSIRCQGAKDFGIALKNTNIAKVNLSLNRISSQGVIDFGSTLYDTKVTDIDLSYNFIGRQGVIGFAETLKDTRVRKVNLSNNLFGYQGALGFCTLLKDTCVTEVNLEQPDMTLTTARGICQLLRGTQVQKLILSPGLQEEIKDEINAMYQFNSPANRSLKAMILASLAQNPEQAMLLKALPKNIFHPHFSNKYDERRVEDIVNDPNIAIPATELERVKKISDLYVHPQKTKINRL